MGYFITIEGGEGSGKTSVLQEVIKLLNNDGYTNIVTSREPGGIKIATQIREVLLDKENTAMDPLTETFLFAASRRQHIVEKVLPNLDNGAIFIKIDPYLEYVEHDNNGDIVEFSLIYECKNIIIQIKTNHLENIG